MTTQNTELSNQSIDTLTDAQMEAIAMQLNAIEPGAGSIAGNSYFGSDIMAFLESTMILDAIAIVAVCYMMGIILLNLFPNLKGLLPKSLFERKAS